MGTAVWETRTLAPMPSECSTRAQLLCRVLGVGCLRLDLKRLWCALSCCRPETPSALSSMLSSGRRSLSRMLSARDTRDQAAKDT